MFSKISQHVLQALFLIEFLLKTANERFIADVRERSDDISKLRAYKYIEEERDIAGDGMFHELNTWVDRV